MSTLAHPAVSAAQFAAAMSRSGWTAPVELINEEVVAIEPQGGSAAFAQTELTGRLKIWQAGGPGLLLSDVFVAVGGGYLAPDIAWWSAGREPKIETGAITRVPDLVVEVLSPATRENDLGPKRHAYLSAGVHELWLVDPIANTVLAVTGAVERVNVVGDEVSSPLLPGFFAPVADLFA